MGELIFVKEMMPRKKGRRAKMPGPKKPKARKPPARKLPARKTIAKRSISRGISSKNSRPVDRIGAVLSEILPLIKPSPQEAASELAFAESIRDHISSNAPEGTETVIVGSMAKGTFLRDKRDIDIFVLFDPKFPRSGLEPAVRAIMARAFRDLNYQVSYAEHPYVRFHSDGRRIDLVPAYKITCAAERVSAVDRSVLHTVFVVDSLRKGQEGEVLLLKQFLRANGIYGAEIKTEGFSGYLCELLIIKYGTFTNLLRSASKWKENVFIDLEVAYKRSGIPAAHERFGGFVVIDPTDRNRNVAAAVSSKSLRRFISLSKAFLKRPSKEFFLREMPDFEELMERFSKKRIAFVVSMPRPAIVDDVLWGQLKKMCGQLEAHLDDFSCPEIITDDSRHLVRLGIVLKTERLPDMMLVAGPPLGMKKHVKDFRKSHPKAKFIMKSGKIWTQVKRPITKADAAIRQFFRLFSKTKSHLAYPEEMLVIERFEAGAKTKGKKK